METFAVGTDICSIDRIRDTHQKYGERFLDKILTAAEKSYVISRNRSMIESLAGRFAAKEAVSKALGVGLRGLAWKEIEIGRAPSGAPYVMLHGRASKIAKHKGFNRFEISISHERQFAVAFVVAAKMA
jgi:holo-[acyl-carrier protein] synthase